MSSESSGEKPDPKDALFASARANARVASAWGPARTALAAVHNLEVLLRTSHVPGATILELLPELRGGAGVLRDAFERSQGRDRAACAAGEFGALRVKELDSLLDTLGSLADRRQDFAKRAGALADALEASVDLLALLDRAAAPLVTDVRLDLLAREAGRMTSSARGRELAVRFDEPPPYGVLSSDPTVLGALVSLLIASVHAGAPDTSLVLRARSSPKAQFIVEPCRPADSALALLSIRVMPWIAPSEIVARRVAADLGATLDVCEMRALLTLPALAD